MELEGRVKYLDMIRESVRCIAEEAEKIWLSDPINGLNLNLLRKDYLSHLIREVEKGLGEYLVKSDSFSPKRYAEINEKVSRSLDNLRNELENINRKAKNLRNAKDRVKNIEKMLKEMELEHYIYFW